jgi:hypothetical protein
MVKARTAAVRGRMRIVAIGMAVVCLVLGGVQAVRAEPTVAQMLTFRPRQEGVSCTTPTAEKANNCKVTPIKRGEKIIGWALKDEDGNLLRKFIDSNDDNHIDVWTYCKDGVEVYSEIDTEFTGKPNQFRWLNAGGMKWGIDENKDGKIDTWKQISPEELSQELLAALAKNDVARFQALLISEAELKALPADMANRIREQIKGAADRFQETITKLGPNLGPKTAWLHLETAAPQCLTAEQTGAAADIIKHARGTVLFDIGGGNDWVQTGEMIQVAANSWRLTGGPAAGAAPPDGNKGIDDPEVAKLVQELGDLDKHPPEPGDNAALVKHHLKRADLLEKIVAKVKPQEREQWIRQVADSLSTAAQASPKDDTTALERLRTLEAALAKPMPTHNLTAYVTFREMQADYAARLGSRKDEFTKVQQEWLERLTKFVKDFPRAEDTPDAMLQAGMVAEFLGKDVEAKNWYTQLASQFADKPQAAKGKGAVERLGLEGQTLRLSGPTLADTSTTYDIEQVRGKVVLVYYWASWNSQSVGDFAKLKTLVETYGTKGLELVCVNLDSSIEDGRKFLKSASAAATHLYQANGLEGKLATDYGILVLPQLFLVGKDGKVVNRNAQIANVEDELKKLLK